MNDCPHLGCSDASMGDSGFRITEVKITPTPSSYDLISFLEGSKMGKLRHIVENDSFLEAWYRYIHG